MENLVATIEDREILRDLFFESKNLSIYFFHKKYMMSPGQLSRSLSKFESLGVIAVAKDQVELTAYGKKWVILNRKDLFLTKPNEYWKESSSVEKRELKTEETYLPKRKLLDKDFFKSLYYLSKIGLGASDSST